MHGQRTRAYLYRNFIPALTKLSRVIVPHHMGFGKSETPQDKAYSIREREHTDIWRSYKLFLPCASSVKKTARLRQISVCSASKVGARTGLWSDCRTLVTSCRKKRRKQCPPWCPSSFR